MNKCDACTIRGECCYWYIIIDNQPQKFAICPFLDPNTKLCIIYEKRYSVNPYCRTIEQAKIQNTLPEECLYLEVC